MKVLIDLSPTLDRDIPSNGVVDGLSRRHTLPSNLQFHRIYDRLAFRTVAKQTLTFVM